MPARWHKRACLVLLALALCGLGLPAAEALASLDHGCAGMAGEDHAGPQAPARCQWLTPMPCCDDVTLSGAPATPAPPPACLCFAASLPPRLASWRPAPAARPGVALGLSGVVLRL